MPPLYEYECPRCGVFETVQRITAPALKKCPNLYQAGSQEIVCMCSVKRLISLTSGFVIEPNGTYVPVDGRDANGRQREEKISPRAFKRQDDALRKRMLATRDFAKREGFTPTPT
jgi:putative FmdB family regulatory protein